MYPTCAVREAPTRMRLWDLAAVWADRQIIRSYVSFATVRRGSFPPSKPRGFRSSGQMSHKIAWLPLDLPSERGMCGSVYRGRKPNGRCCRRSYVMRVRRLRDARYFERSARQTGLAVPPPRPLLAPPASAPASAGDSRERTSSSGPSRLPHPYYRHSVNLLARNSVEACDGAAPK